MWIPLSLMTSLRNLAMSDSFKNQAEVVVRNTTPPNWLEIVERFPIVKEHSMNVVFTYAPHIYIPGGMEITPDVWMHENVHLKQQEELGVRVWWECYLKDDQFRLDQELEAYGLQLAMFNGAPGKVREYHKDRLAMDLSSAMYGNIISFGEAASKIRRIAKEIKRENLSD